MAVTVLTILFLLTLAINALAGLTRGMSKSLIRFVTLLPAVILSFVLTPPITAAIAGENGLGGKLMPMVTEWINNSDLAVVFRTAPLLWDTLAAIPAFLIAILFLPLIFFALCFVTWILYLLIQKPLRRLIFREQFDEEGEVVVNDTVSTASRVGKRLAGLGVGLLTGAVAFGVFMAPLFAVFTMLPPSHTVEHTLEVMAEHDLIDREDVAQLHDGYAVTDCALVKFYRAMGSAGLGRMTINAASDFEVNGETMHPADELETALAVITTALEGGLVDAIVEKEDPAALLELLSDEAFMEKLMQDLFRSRLLCSAVPNLVADAMNDLAGSLHVPEEDGVLHAAMFREIENTIRAANLNPTVLRAYDGSGSTDELYLAELRKLGDLSVQLAAVVDRYMAGDNREFAACMADYIVADIRAQSIETGSFFFDPQRMLSRVDPSQLILSEGDAGEMFLMFSDPDSFRTDLPTMLSIRASVHKAVSDAVADKTSASRTASTLASIVADFTEIAISAANAFNHSDAAPINFDSLSDAVTELQHSNLKGVGATFLDMLAAGDPGSSRMVRDVLETVKDGYESGEDITALTDTAGSLINLASSLEGSNREVQQESVRSFILNLNSETVDILVSLLSDEMFTEMGVPAQYAASTRAVFKTLLTELGKLEGAEDYENEVHSTLLLLRLITTDPDGLSAADIARFAQCAAESDAIFNTLMTIAEENPFGIKIENGALRVELTNAINDFYAVGGKTDRDREVCRAVASLLGLSWT